MASAPRRHSTLPSLGIGLLFAALTACSKPVSEPARRPPPGPLPAAPASAATPFAAEAETSERAENTGGAPLTLDQAEAELERAQQELDRVVLAEPRRNAQPPPASAPASGAGAAAEKKAERAAPAPRAQAAPTPEADSAASAPAGAPAGCETACKAYASLLRAKAAVCRLDEPGGPHCARAEQIAERAKARVASCSCSA
jgi:hypothetical protein